MRRDIINIRKVIRTIAVILLILLLNSCSESSGSIEPNWQLVWQDEFNGPAGQSPDPEKWDYNIGTFWGNGQLEYDTDRPVNVALDGDGNLAIIAREENFMGSNYTSARIATRGLFERTYGRFEARIFLPWGRGIWPAFWMLGVECAPINFPDENSGWPQCGEIDIMEYNGERPSIIHGSIHGPGYSGGNPVTNTYQLTQDRFDLDFHTFSVEWGSGYIKWYVDETLYHEVEAGEQNGAWVFDGPFYLILNLAVGGAFVNPPDANTVFPQTMLVDWVRVYEEAP